MIYFFASDGFAIFWKHFISKFDNRQSTIEVIDFHVDQFSNIFMSTNSQRFRMMLAKIERHVQKCDEMWWNEILSRKFPCYYFCIIFNKSSLKNVYIIRKVRFFIAIYRLVYVFDLCLCFLHLQQQFPFCDNFVRKSKMELIFMSNYSRRFSMVCSWNSTIKSNQIKSNEKWTDES